MAVNVKCLKCQSYYAVGTKKCKKCKASLLKSRKYRVVVKLPSGKWKTKIVDSLELARKIEAKYVDEVVRMGELGLLKAPLIDEAWESLHEQCKRTLKHPGTYEKQWRVHIAPYFSGARLDAITPKDILSFVTHLERKQTFITRKNPKKGKKPLAVSTVVRMVKLVGRIYNHARDMGMYHGGNPISRVKLPKFNNQVNNPLSDGELKRLLRTLSTWPNRMAAIALELCLITGKRTGEIFGLTWDRIDLEQGRVQFIVKSQTLNDHQWLPITERGESLLKEARKKAHCKSPLVFHTTQGKRIRYRAIWLRIKKAAKLREEIRPHDLRHTFATRLACSGEVDIYTIQRLLGHKTISMTQRYAHLMDQNLKRGLEVADRALK